MKKTIIKQRNFVAKALAKVTGFGIHEKPLKVKRQNDKIILKQTLKELDKS